MRTILVVDDDERLRALLAEYLGGRGFSVETAGDGEAALERLRRGGIDLAVLDLMMPKKDGLAVCREVRASSRLPIIMLTARGDEMDRIVGLELGADDYLPKPFNPRELVARIEAVLRRAEARPEPAPSLRAGPIRVDPDRRVASVNGAELDLTTTEFELRASAKYAQQLGQIKTLLYLMADPDKLANEHHHQPNLQNILVDRNQDLWMIDNSYNLGAAPALNESMLPAKADPALAHGVADAPHAAIKSTMGTYIGSGDADPLVWRVGVAGDRLKKRIE